MFGTSGIRGRVGEAVTAELALEVGRALAAECERVVIGRDARASGAALADAASAGCRECGADVVRLGLAATPTIARSVGWRDADAGIAVTASHNPPEDNGLKLWQPSGQAFDEARRDRISERVAAPDPELAAWDGHGTERTWDRAGERHVAAIADAVTLKRDLHVAVDLGTGMGGVTVDALLELGGTVETLNAQPDGRFPGRPSEPTAEHCGSLRSFVANTDAELGIAHDGDADRMLAVTADGEWIGGDVLLALFGRAAAAAGDRVAVPVDTSLAVADALAEVGAEVTRTKVGDVYVAERAVAPDVAFGGEPSGAWIWPDATLCPDGPLAAAKLAALVAREGPLADLAAGIETYPIRRDSYEVDDKAAVMERVRERVADEYDADRIDAMDGLRVELEDGWFLVRPSGTQPLVRVTAEARDPDRSDAVLAIARDLVERALKN